MASSPRVGPAGVEALIPKILPKPSTEPTSGQPSEPATAPATKPKADDIDLPAPSATPRRDGTHLNARGSIEFGAIVAEELRRVLPETQPLFRP